MGSGPQPPPHPVRLVRKGGSLEPFPSVPAGIFPIPLPGPTSPTLLLECSREPLLSPGKKKVPRLLTQKEKKRKKKDAHLHAHLHIFACSPTQPELAPASWVVTFPAGRTPCCSPLPRSPEPTLLAHPGWRQTPSSGKGFSSLHDPDLCWPKLLRFLSPARFSSQSFVYQKG